MSELFEKSIRVLELPRLLEMLEHHAVSAEAKARARRLTPSDDFGEVNRLLDETDAARKMIMLRGSPAFGGVRDVGEALSRAERGGMLNTRELLNIAGLLTNVRRVQDYYKENEEGTVIDKLFLSLHPNRFLEEKITTAILDENEIADAASPELAEIRRHKRAAAAQGPPNPPPHKKYPSEPHRFTEARLHPPGRRKAVRRRPRAARSCSASFRPRATGTFCRTR